MNINLELYKIFYHVALNGSFTRAANELMISQPAISRSIKTLEEQLNITLFVRNHDGITLSKAGKKIFEKVKIAMKQIESIDDETENYVGVEDEDIVEKVYTIFKKNHADEFDFTD